MIIKIKKRNLIILTLVLAFLLAPIAYAAFIGVVVKGFGVEFWITNNAPVVIFDNGTSTTFFDSTGTDPTEGSTTLVWFVFNVTDTNGDTDIDKKGFRFNLTLGTPGLSQFRYNQTCANISTIDAQDKVIFNCSVYMFWFDNTSVNWVINGSANDSTNARVNNGSVRFAYNQLSAMSFAVAYINFSTITIGQNDQAAANPLILNNTGNDDFDQINITASDLTGQTNPGESIAVNLFAVNSTNAVAGKGLPLTTGPQTIRALAQSGADTLDNLTLSHGHTSALTDYNDNIISAKGNQSLYFWVDDPGAVSSQKYNATWNISVIDLS